MNRRQYHTAVENWSHALYRFALKFLRDPAAADDAVQDAFMKLWSNRQKVDPNKVKSWLFSTAHNAMLNRLKKDSRQQPFDSRRHDQPHEDKHRFELKDIIDRSLEKLPAVQRSIVLLRDLEGYNYKEIGEMLSLTESQVKVYLFRARKKLKDELKDIYELQ